MGFQRTAPNNTARDYSKCDVCGITLEPDRLQIMIDNGYQIRNVFCCRKHRYVEVDFNGNTYTQDRSDREIEHLATQFRNGQLSVGWE
jgi:hypothetical protein